MAWSLVPGAAGGRGFVGRVNYLMKRSIDLVSVRPSNRTEPIQIRYEVLARLDDLGVATNEVLRDVSESRSRVRIWHEF